MDPENVNEELAPTPLPGAVEPSGYPPLVERLALPFVNDFGLLPILIAIIGHFSIALAPLLLWALRGRSPFGVAGVIVLLVLSFEVVQLDIRARRRPAALSLVLLITWTLAAAAAWAGNRYGLL